MNLFWKLIHYRALLRAMRSPDAVVEYEIGRQGRRLTGRAIHAYRKAARRRRG